MLSEELTDSGLDFPLILSFKSSHEKPQNKWWFDLWSWHDTKSTSCLAAFYDIVEPHQIMQ